MNIHAVGAMTEHDKLLQPPIVNTDKLDDLDAMLAPVDTLPGVSLRQRKPGYIGELPEPIEGTWEFELDDQAPHIDAAAQFVSMARAIVRYPGVRVPAWLVQMCVELGQAASEKLEATP